MPIIESIKKKGKKYNIIFQDGESLELFEEMILKYHLLRSKIVLDEMILEQIKLDNLQYEAIERGLKYLAGLHTKKEVVTYLKKYYTHEISQYATDRIASMGYLNELRYAEVYLLGAIRKEYGPIVITKDLQEKGISTDIIETVLKQYSEEMQLDAMEQLSIKFIKNKKNKSNRQLTEELKQHLQYRGYPLSLAKDVMLRLQSTLEHRDEEAVLKKELEKTTRKYQQKYQGKELNTKIIHSLLQKGYDLSKIKQALNKECSYD